MKLKLSLSCGYYDRTKALLDGEVQPEDIELICEKSAGPDQLFRRIFDNEEFDISELSLSNYIYARDLGFKYIAIPVFPSRRFRHADIFVNKSSGIRSPKDLEGKRIGCSPCYYVTAATWQRGILEHEYDVAPNKMKWFTPMPERLPIRLPSNVTLEAVSDVDTSLRNGEIDAMMGPLRPVDFPKSTTIVRLFQDVDSVEKQYFRKTGIFPLMHVIVIRESIWRENKWITTSLIDAFNRSKERWREHSASRLGGPVWIDLLMEEEERVLGHDPYPYNLKDNAKALETLIEYCGEQAVMRTHPTVDELFVDNAT